jgi:copper chaperone CopZ
MMEEVLIKVGGMSCQGCVKNVTGALSATPGVASVVVSLEAGRGEGELRPGPGFGQCAARGDRRLWFRRQLSGFPPSGFIPDVSTLTYNRCAVIHLTTGGSDMGFDQVKAGKDVPNDINVIIEISAQGDPIKFEVDKDSGAIFVDRFMGTSMRYPINYGYVPHTIAGDGDPVDVLVVTPFPLARAWSSAAVRSAC